MCQNSLHQQHNRNKDDDKCDFSLTLSSKGTTAPLDFFGDSEPITSLADAHNNNKHCAKTRGSLHERKGFLETRDNKAILCLVSTIAFVRSVSSRISLVGVKKDKKD